MSGHLSPGRQVAGTLRSLSLGIFPACPGGSHWSSSDSLGSGLPKAEILVCDSAFNAEVRTAGFQEMEEAENSPCAVS